MGTTNGISGTLGADAQSVNDRFFGTHASLAPGPINTGEHTIDTNLDLGYEKWRLRLVEMQRNDQGTGAGIASALDPVGKTDTERSIADLSWSNPELTRTWGLGFDANIQRYVQTIPSYYDLFPPGASFPTGTFPNGMIGAPETWEREMRMSANATYSGFEGHAVRFGMGFDDFKMDKTAEFKNFVASPSGLPVPTGSVSAATSTTIFLTPHEREDMYAFLQDEWRFARDWALTAGLRADDYSDFGLTTNPRLALVWDVSQNITAKLLYGHAFRAPSFTEEYSVNNPVAKGNASLMPETIVTYEAAMTWQALPNLRIMPSVFYYKLKDIIVSVSDSSVATGTTFQNTGSQHGSGFELEATWDATPELKFTGNVANQHSIDDSTDQDAGYVPHMHFNGRADWTFLPGWTADAQANYVSQRKRAAGDFRPSLPDYATLDLALRNTGALEGWDFTGAVRNVSGEKCLEPSLAPGQTLPYDLPVNPRTYYFQVSHRF